ncbi:hypothetical protein FRC19_001123 [Serendipita sp. 401]|nr:hypothetical protein FRC19_001123 [Serendipita sp. 401]
MKENQGRIVGKQYYWIDLQRFCNVVKWRISDMRNQIENSLKAELDNKGYICPRCTKSFTALEVDQVFDPMRNVLACDVCNTELEDNEHSEKVQGSKDRMQRFNAQMKYIRDALRDIEGVVVPAFDVVRYVREQMAAQKAAGMLDEDGLKIATGSARVQEVEIQMVEDEDEEEKRREKQKSADEKRRQNAMPTWHTNSTISGDKTALGIQADERSNNDALLAVLDAQAKNSQEKSTGVDTFGYPFAGGYPPMPGYYNTPNSSQSQRATQSAGTSGKTTPSQSDSDSSQDITEGRPMNGTSKAALTVPSTLSKPKRPTANGPEKRVSFAEQVHERSASPMPPPSQASSTTQEEYNPWVKVAGKDVRARDVKEGDEELMTAEEYEAFWPIKEKMDELDAGR